MEKVWNWDDLITKYITEKTRNGYQLGTSIDEMVDFLDYITYFVTVSNTAVSYKDVVEEYINGNGSKRKEWSVKDEEFKFLPVAKKLDSGLIVPTYNLVEQTPRYGIFDTEEKSYDDKFKEYLRQYMKKYCKKRETELYGYYDPETISFCERASAAIMKQIWERKKSVYQEKGQWPIQCNDITKYLLECDLADTMGLPAMRKELRGLYDTVIDRLLSLSQEDKDFRMTNFEDEVLAKSNFDLAIGSFLSLAPYYKTVDKHHEGVILDRKEDELQTVIDWYEGNVKKESLSDEKVLKLVEYLEKSR